MKCLYQVGESELSCVLGVSNLSLSMIFQLDFQKCCIFCFSFYTDQSVLSRELVALLLMLKSQIDRLWNFVFCVYCRSAVMYIMFPVSVLAILGIFLLMFSESFMVIYIYISNLPYFGIYYAHLFIICGPLEILKNCGKMEIFIDNAKAFFSKSYSNEVCTPSSKVILIIQSRMYPIVANSIQDGHCY